MTRYIFLLSQQHTHVLSLISFHLLLAIRTQSEKTFNSNFQPQTGLIVTSQLSSSSISSVVFWWSISRESHPPHPHTRRPVSRPIRQSRAKVGPFARVSPPPLPFSIYCVGPVRVFLIVTSKHKYRHLSFLFFFLFIYFFIFWFHPYRTGGLLVSFYTNQIESNCSMC